MRAVWKYLLPHCAHDFCGFENWVDAVIEDTGITGKDLGFVDVNSPSVRECLSFTATHWHLIEFEQQRTYDEKEEIVPEGEGCVSKEILIKETEQIFQKL
jgi:hypothetical protein